MMFSLRQHCWVLAALPLVSIGCAAAAPPPPPPKTGLMQRLESDGAGDLSGPGVTTETLTLWLKGKPQAYTQDLRTTCTDIRSEPLTVAWHDSVDSKICSAVDAVSFFRVPPQTQSSSASKTYLGGAR
jgi:hypothetical protein